MRLRTFCAIGAVVVMAAVACGGGSTSDSPTRDDIVEMLDVAPPLPEGASWTRQDGVRERSFDDLRRALEADGGYKDVIDQLRDAGIELDLARTWVSSGRSAQGVVVRFRDEAGADKGLDALQHLTPSWFYPVPVGDLGDEAVSAKGDPGAVYIWRRGNLVLSAWMYLGGGSRFDFDAAARAYADELDQRASLD